MVEVDVGRRLLAGLTVLVLAGGCTGSPSMTSTAPTPEPTATAVATPAPTRTANPTPTAAPTIGEPADDGARIIAVESPATLARRVQAGADFVDASPVPTTRTGT